MQYLRGKFIVFDGGEGSGKTTQAQLLLKALQDSAVPAILVRDPGSTRIGEMIRKILLDPENLEMSMRCEMLLYMASRAQMMKETITPALAEGKCVLCDRFVSSTLAYQLGGEGLTYDQIHQVGDVAISGRWPDLTIFFEIPVEKSTARIKRQPDRIERRPIEYHRQVRDNYLAQAARDPRKFRIINADRDHLSVHAEIIRLLAAFFQ